VKVRVEWDGDALGASGVRISNGALYFSEHVCRKHRHHGLRIHSSRVETVG
jgi:hypothetical protein